MSGYVPGSVKQDPVSLATATRVNDGLPEEWLVVELGRGGRFASFGVVASWVDLGRVL